MTSRPTAAPTGRRLRVLQSVRGPSRTTNPYIVQLVDALSERADVRYFTWRSGLLSRYDVLHVHWPEVMVRRAGRAARWAARARFALLMTRITVMRTPVVRTLHNLGAHERGSQVEQILLRWCDRRTRHWVLLNAAARPALAGPSSVIPHGHYVDWFAPHARLSPVARRIVMFGLIRPYKGTEDLLAAFAELDDEGATLRVVGSPTTLELRRTVEDACAADPRVSALLEYVDDATLSREVSAAQLVVLPYRDMHNSGALMLALSLNRPVLVPRGPVTTSLRDEVGSSWVLTFADRLTAADLVAALDAAATDDADAAVGPGLARRDWPDIGSRHQAVYEGVARRRRR